MPIYTGYVEGFVMMQRKKTLEELKKKILGSAGDAAGIAAAADCPSPPRPLGIFGGGVSVDGAFSAGVIQCGSLRLPRIAPDNYVDLASLIPYFRRKCMFFLIKNTRNLLKRHPDINWWALNT